MNTQVSFFGGEELAGEFTTTSGEALTWIASIEGLSIPYHDEDDSGEFHIEVKNENATTDTVQAEVNFHFVPSYPA